MRLFVFLGRVMADARGISAVEYGILVGVVGVALAGVMGTLSGDISELVTSAVTDLNTAADAAAGRGADD